jgi:hypothetical protein
MSVTKPTKPSLEKASHLLRKPDARLVRLHSKQTAERDSKSGRVVVVSRMKSRNCCWGAMTAAFPGHPQSWRLGNRRDWAERV